MTNPATPTPDHVVMIQRCGIHNKANIILLANGSYSCFICGAILVSQTIDKPLYEGIKDAAVKKV